MKAGIEDGTFHDLRSICISEWLERGLMPKELKELAGDADIKTIMSYYVGIKESLWFGLQNKSLYKYHEDNVSLCEEK